MTFTSSAKVETGGRRRGERGQTILLVAISIVALLAMAALAIDVVSLYVARTEVQRAADAAALAGAKAIADSGITTLQAGDANLPAAQALATDMATKAILALLQATPPINQVAGGQPVQVGSPVFNFTLNNNPLVTVTLQQTNLPTFFARVFGTRSSIATGTATAEAYNPSNMQNFTPLQTTCVKPWLIANQDPVTLNRFVDRVTGAVEAPLGEQFWLSSDCSNASDCFVRHSTPPGISTTPDGSPFVYFVPLQVTPNPGDVCPSASASPCGGGTNPNFKQAIECCNTTLYTCGGTVTNAAWDQTLSPEHGGSTSDLALGTECLIHASGETSGQGQDSLDWTTAPFPTGPPRIVAGSGPQIGNNVSTSSSIVTIPILDTQAVFPTTPPLLVTVVGFLQAFVNRVDDQGAAHRGDVNITVLNVIGCSQTPRDWPPVIGGNGASPIPVRLVSPQ